MYVAACKPTTTVNQSKERMNTVGIDVASLIAQGYGNCEAVVESTANLWIHIRWSQFNIINTRSNIRF